MSGQRAETRPEWGENPHHVCDWLCDAFADEAHKRQVWRAEIETALHGIADGHLSASPRPAPAELEE